MIFISSFIGEKTRICAALSLSLDLYVYYKLLFIIEGYYYINFCYEDIES
jgi:hypothetical protein